ncbi:SRPBCC family protein (plasmid) [Pseudonocardia bannensis]|uniref:Carbon monoxide dehydrogenase subunit G n=1 Tax=Pseudonocardia bannensis TaxID=630973 RepID=A0A848DKN6_9PSEU|nr:MULTISPECIES: carbon monoxide dehydrogenase subunit G [Pseudonocardia]NMH93031.1 carbon monoxide dehydrogenase subunit G [Pseudonocardia bannensis]
MKVSGEVTLQAPISEVWAALTDPTVLERTIPGCERLEANGTNRYTMTVTAGVASVKGTYLGEVALTDQQRPDSFVLRASGSGGPGTVKAEVDVTLKEIDHGSTQLSYAADAAVGGAIAGVGQRMLAGVAKKMADEFFRSVNDVLTGKAPAPSRRRPTPAPAAPAAGQPASAPPTGYAPAAAGAAPDGAAFRQGVAVGAVIGLAGVLVGALVSRLARR